MSRYFPLTPGQRGEPIRDLQRRLGAAGFAPDGAEAGSFCGATEAAVRAFQAARGLRPTGLCDQLTWLALVEASWRLGDRMLVLSAPNLRGDDVAELQTRLGRIGFDCGRVDGILGPATARAIEDFQRNCGLVVDGICGPETVHALDVLTRQSGTGPGVAALREIASLTAGERTLGDLRVVVGQFGGLSGLTRRLTHAVRHRGATVTPTDELDAPAQAAAANRFAATVYVGFEARSDATWTVCYYAVPTFESAGGRALAGHLATAFERHVGGDPLDVAGMRLPVLRETRMPAVLCTLGPVQRVVDATPAIVTAVVEALDAWASAPVGAHD